MPASSFSSDEELYSFASDPSIRSVGKNFHRQQFQRDYGNHLQRIVDVSCILVDGHLGCDTRKDDFGRGHLFEFLPIFLEHLFGRGHLFEAI